MLNANDYLISKLAERREVELREKARVAWLLADARVKKPKLHVRFLAGSGEILIILGQKLKERYDPELKAGLVLPNVSLEMTPCES